MSTVQSPESLPAPRAFVPRRHRPRATTRRTLRLPQVFAACAPVRASGRRRANLRSPASRAHRPAGTCASGLQHPGRHPVRRTREPGGRAACERPQRLPAVRQQPAPQARTRRSFRARAGPAGARPACRDASRSAPGRMRDRTHGERAQAPPERPAQAMPPR